MSGGGGGDIDWRPAPKKPGTDATSDADVGPGDPCVVEELTSLNSVSPVTLRYVRPGALLDVVFFAGPPQRLVAQDHTGQVIGSITSRGMLQIIECIQRDRRYVAEVLGIQGGFCHVRVRLA